MNDQQIIQALAKVREGRLALCECGGKGYVRPDNTGLAPWDDEWRDKIPCPKCAPMRELELCWHESMEKRMYTCKHCKAHPLDQFPNPRLTTHQHGSKLWITHVLDVLGLLDEFLNCPWLTPMDLLDGKLLVLAIGAWLEERGE